VTAAVRLDEPEEGSARAVVDTHLASQLAVRQGLLSPGAFREDVPRFVGARLLIDRRLLRHFAFLRPKK